MTSASDEDLAVEPRRKRLPSLSLREYLGLVTIVMLVIGVVATGSRLRSAQAELSRLRSETGYLAPTEVGQIAAARVPSDQPLTWRVRVRTPGGQAKYRVAYSSIWRKDQSVPDWYSAVVVPAGESVVTVQIHEDPRDHIWKLSTYVRAASDSHTRRMSTNLPPDHVQVFRGSHDVVRTGVTRETVAVSGSESIRLLDERWLVGEGGLLLYGDKAPRRDQIGIYAELQPDVGPLLSATIQ